MSSLLIQNATAVVTMNEGRETLYGVDILCDDGVIQSISQSGKPRSPHESAVPSISADAVIDADGMIVYPGLINTHHHLYQSMTRNISRVQHLELFDWLKALYQVWKGIDEEAVYYGALVGLGELLKSGCTTSCDHHYVFPKAAGYRLIDAELEAAAELGIRMVACRGSMSKGEKHGGLPPDNLVEDIDDILQDSERLINKYHDPSATSMRRIALAPCSPFSVSDDLMRETASIARMSGVRLHTHLAETRDEELDCLEKTGMRPLAYMESLGWLGPDVWFAHGVHFTGDEVNLLAVSSTGVAHCPTSNMKLSSGRAGLEAFLEAGVPVGLGVDGSASNDCSNMISEIRTCYLLHRLELGPCAPRPEDILHVATVGGASVIGWPELGRIAVGHPADMFAVDASNFDWVGAESGPMAALATLGCQRPVSFTIVAGKVVVSDGELVNVDEPTLAEQARKISRRLCAS
ncbi:MAG: 8-oxoguanine deaminase [Firmicutes bacterium]|jgi:cytosine/adenosine deaminase-related metal-dependent hydrolase|nr:8-oxoguanine deaminase [Bacillota bacterium]